MEKPQTKITCLGIDIDAKNGILTVPDKKMEKKVDYVHNGDKKRAQQETNYRNC